MQDYHEIQTLIDSDYVWPLLIGYTNEELIHFPEMVIKLKLLMTEISTFRID